MVKLWYPNLWNDRGIFNCFILHKKTPDPTHTFQRRRGKCNRKRKFLNQTQTEHFPVAHKREDTTRKKLLSSLLWEKLFLEPPLLKPLSAQFPELPGGKVTRKKNTLKPMESEDPAAQLWLTALLAVSWHHEMPAFGKSHRSVITTRHTSGYTRNKKNLGFNN